MLVMLFKKVYLVDEDNEPPKSIDVDKRYLSNYLEFKKEHPTLLTLYRNLMTNILPNGETNSNIILLIVKRKDVNIFIQDYCNYLGLDYNAYRLIIKHSKFCTKYIDNIGDIFSLNNDFPIIDRKDYVYEKKKIKKEYEFFPVEYAINSINQEWAKIKFNHLRLWDIYMFIKDCQMIWYHNGLEIPDPVKRFYMGHASSKLLRNPEIENEVLNMLSEMDIHKGFCTKDISEYLNTNPNFGYDQHTAFKYNKPLANYLKNMGYRIDE